MKVLFINPPIREWAKPNVLPLGLAYLSSVLMAAGHEVEVMDINAYRWSAGEVEEKIRNADYDVAGIGAIVTVYRYVKWLASTLKKHHPRKPVMVGGSVGTSVPHIILGKTEADIVCIGEGEITIVEIMKALENGKDLSSVEGIWFKDKRGALHDTGKRAPIRDLDVLPLPAWDLFPMDIYLKNPVGAPNRNKWIDGGSNKSVLTMNISGTRGCPYQCTYCYHDFMGHKYRNRSPKNMVNEIRVLKERYGVEYVHFVDDEFCLKKEMVFEFCDLMKKEFGGSVTWGCSGRVNLMTEGLVAAMVDAGCVAIGYGIESGSQRMLDVMKKGATVAQAKEAIKLTKKYLGWADCSFMIGTPGEDRETVKETVDFCKELDLAPEVIFFMTPYPGTELYRKALDEGRITDEEEYILGLGEQGEKVRVNFSGLSDKELFEVQEKMIKELNAWNKIKHPESV